MTPDDGVTLIVEAVEETKGGLRIKAPKTDSGNRRVDLPPFAIQALRDHQLAQKKEHLALGLGWSVDTLVFPNPLGDLQRPRNFTKSVTRLAKSAASTSLRTWGGTLTKVWVAIGWQFGLLSWREIC